MRRLLTADWVLPVTSPVIPQGGVLIDDAGRIEAVGPAAALRSESIERLDFGRAALLPGLINVHAHPELAPFRGLLDDLPFHLWIPALMKMKRGAALTEDDLVAAAQWTCVESARAGITAMGATETSGAAVHALRAAGLRGLVYLETFGPAAAQASASIAELRDRIEALALQTTPRVRLGVSPHAPYSVSDALYSATATFARTAALPLAAHVAEGEAEEQLVREGAGPFAAGLRARGIATPPRARSTVELLDRLDVIDENALLIHCVRLDEADLQRIAARGAAIAHCPVANARLGHGCAPMVEARALGIPVAIGTDSVASNNRIDLLEEAHSAQLGQRARLCASGVFSSAELLHMVTIDAARALHMDAAVGSLERGKDADVCVVSFEPPHTRPMAGPEDALFHAARGSDIVLTMVQGRIIYDGHRVLPLAEAELATRMDELSARLLRARDSA